MSFNRGVQGAAMRAAAGCLLFSFLLAGQQHQPTPVQRQQPVEDAAAVDRGRALFQSTCGFCHGNDATGSRAPDLVRSPILNHDDHGNLLGPVIRNGRPDKGMPSFSTMKDDQIADIVAFLHHQATAALRSSHVPRDYPLAKLMTGNAQAGKAYFDGAGGCSGCHSAAGDLAGIANRYQGLKLEERMLYPQKAPAKVVVTLASGEKVTGTLEYRDEFTIGLRDEQGWYRSWPAEEVKYTVNAPAEAHVRLLARYTDADIHNLMAYLQTLK